MSLWTPSGEHPVDRQPRAPGSPDPEPTATGGGGGPVAEPPSQEGDGEATDAARAEELRRHLAATPAEVVVANHCYGLFELAAVYLSQSPPLLAPARLAIDSLGYLVEGLGERLGEARPTLSDALAQIRLAYVQMDADQARAAGPAPAPNGGG